MASQVKVLVYDLSQGLASQMSEAILGQRIDGIWHTGVVVFGYEYFFGGGIQCLREGVFPSTNRMRPVRVHEVGVTSKSREELQAYLRSINHLFTQQTYDLIRNNCNNFSDTVCRFLVGQGIPSYIIDLPNIVFSTPGGMMLRPYFENMQNAIQGGNGMDPFSRYGGDTTTFDGVNHNTTAATNNGVSPLNIQTNRVSSGSENNHSRTLSKYERKPSPLISSDSDAKILSTMCAKIINTTSISKHDEHQTSASVLTDHDKISLANCINSLPQDKSKNHTPIPPSIFSMFNKLLEECPSCQMASLFILRLLVLQKTQENLESLVALVKSVVGKIISGPTAFSSVSSMVMGLCVVSNFLSDPIGYNQVFEDSKFNNNFLDALVTLLSHSRLEIRQMTCATLLNIVYIYTTGEEEHTGWKEPSANPHPSGDQIASSTMSSNTEELHPIAVQILCGCIETLCEESDPASRQKKLMLIHRILRSCGATAVSLARDLGFDASAPVLTDTSVGKKVSAEELGVIRDLEILLN